jgi:UDP-GlcNAc:undecaprenyl-phosphate/decaprenyl-phosphate GlcNAc-1-phosphate transferase
MRLEMAAIAGMALLAGRAVAGDDPVLRTEKEKLSYEMGVSMAQTLERQGIEVDVDLLARGVRDGLAGRKLLMSDEEMRQTASALQGEMRHKGAHPPQAPAEAKQKGEAFLAENAKKEGVVTLPSGLQYKVLRAGDGKTPTDADRVVCHYKGTLLDGTVFDSSYGRGRPSTLEMARVIPGWREALKLMPVGSKWQIFVPSRLAYGERGVRGRKRSPPRIGPNATLIFETELLAVQPGPAAPDTRTAAATEPPAAKGN